MSFYSWAIPVPEKGLKFNFLSQKVKYLTYKQYWLLQYHFYNISNLLMGVPCNIWINLYMRVIVFMGWLKWIYVFKLAIKISLSKHIKCLIGIILIGRRKLTYSNVFRTVSKYCFFPGLFSVWIKYFMIDYEFIYFVNTIYDNLCRCLWNYRL